VKFVFIILLLLSGNSIPAQPVNIDSLRKESDMSRNDTLLFRQFAMLSIGYNETNTDSSFYFAEKSLRVAKKLKLRFEEALALDAMAYALMNMGDYPSALRAILTALEIIEDPDTEKYIDVESNRELLRQAGFKLSASTTSLRIQELANLYIGLGLLYENLNDRQRQLTYQYKARELAKQTASVGQLRIIDMIFARTYLAIEKLDSAQFFAENAYTASVQTGRNDYLGSLLLTMGRIQLAKGDTLLAKEHFKRSLKASHEQNYLRGTVVANLMLSDVFTRQNKKDSGLYYANSALVLAQHVNAANLLLRTYKALNFSYKSEGIKDSSLKYQELIIKMNDSLFNVKQSQQFQNIDFNEQLRRREIEAAKKSFQNRLQTYGLLTGLLILLIIAIFLWRSTRQKQKSYSLIKEQKEQTDIQKEKVERTLEELKAAQAQLIQSEKMASLGELTAGIAHEIQNPLNFVNNFSDVNGEMIDELKSELVTGNIKSAIEIADNIKDNEQKINHHGKRAEVIVKGMLQHSRSGSGQTEPSDINILADEYLRLAYHGYRTKEKSFNAKIESNFDPSIQKINLVPQDIGRVLLNLINNAFYAVNEKQKQNIPGYDPTVKLSSKNAGDKIELRIVDNGIGISQKIVDKIFQPFFTTKPTGLGTGLGLSLAYDIVKAHGGEIKLNTKENEGTEFIITLPSTC